MGVEAEADEGREQVGQQWPTQGSVEFSHVTLLYLPWLPPALIDLSFSINPGEHVKSMHLNPKSHPPKTNPATCTISRHHFGVFER
jgi:hypothetical protein